MTQTETRGARGLRVVAGILLLAWVVAGVVNAIGCIMGNTPTPLGTLATLVAVCAWPIAGWFAGSQSGRGFVRLATIFWVAVVAGIPLVYWALVALSVEIVSQVGYLLLFALMAPLYGLVGMLPNRAVTVAAVGVGVAVLAMTLGAYLAGRRIGGRSAEERSA